MALEVEIEKNLPGFRLEVAFTSIGQPLGILGASGAGKSMTLRAIAGVETPTRGRIALNGRVLFDSARKINVPSRARGVGIVFQNYALFPHMSVEENVAFGLRQLPEKQRARRVAEQLADLHLDGFQKRNPLTLSGGEQQRVALARALAPRPEALLLDEPFSALDTHLRSKMERELRETLAGYGGATLVVSHSLEEIYRLCGELIVLDGGRVISNGTRDEVFRNPPSLRAAQLTGCKNLSRARLASNGSVQLLDWGCVVRLKGNPATQAASSGAPLAAPTVAPAGANAAIGHVGIRAHQVDVKPQDAPSFSFARRDALDNVFPGWLADSTEGPFGVTLYLRLNAAPASAGDYHLQAEITPEHWLELQRFPCPWSVRLDPTNLILLSK